MNRKLLVTLLQKNIQELELITQGFMEMTEFPMPIIILAQQKTEDIQLYIKELSVLKKEMPIDNQIESEKNEKENSLSEKIIATEEILLTENEKDEVTQVIEVVDDNEELEVETTFELKADNSEIETDIINTPQNIIESTDVELIVPEELIAEKVVIETEIIIDNNLVAFQEENTQPTIQIIEETRKTILGERNTLTTHTRNELLSKADNSISSTLANKKITDIKQAISIGDRFRFQRELFRSNGEDMNKTLTYINQLATLEEVLSFLKSKYAWATDNDAADDFYQIVKRKFV